MDKLTQFADVRTFDWLKIVDRLQTINTALYPKELETRWKIQKCWLPQFPGFSHHYAPQPIPPMWAIKHRNVWQGVWRKLLNSDYSLDQYINKPNICIEGL